MARRRGARLVALALPAQGARAVLILVVFIVGLVALRLAGGDMRQLNNLRLRWYGVAIAAVVTQIAILIVFPDGWRVGHLLANLATYAAIGVFLWANRRIPWLWVVALGAASNTTAIALNGGVMPASRQALAITHLTPRPGFANSALVSHPRLGFLGDVIPTPPWLPFHNVASVGDVLIVVGALLLVGRQVLSAAPAGGETPVTSAHQVHQPGGDRHLQHDGDATQAEQGAQ